MKHWKKNKQKEQSYLLNCANVTDLFKSQQWQTVACWVQTNIACRKLLGCSALLCTVMLAQAKLRLVRAEESILQHFIKYIFYTAGTFYLLGVFFLVICSSILELQIEEVHSCHSSVFDFELFFFSFC